MNRTIRITTVSLLAALLCATAGGRVFAAESLADAQQKIINDIRIEEKAGSQVPLDATFTDSDGKVVKLGDVLVSGKPTILTVGYFACPMLCDIVLNGLVDGVRGLAYNAGHDYQIVSVSIEPKEDAELADSKKTNYLKSVRKYVDPKGWRFLTGDAAQSKRVADSVGFHFFWDEKQKQYAHAAGIFVLTPEGKVSRTLFGISYEPRDLRLALTEAGEGKFGSAVDKLLLWCYHYDPVGRTYSIVAMNVMRGGGVVVAVALALTLLVMFRLDRRRQKLLVQGAVK